MDNIAIYVIGGLLIVFCVYKFISGKKTITERKKAESAETQNKEESENTEK